MVWGKCTQALQFVVEGLKEYEEKSEDFDIMCILQDLNDMWIKNKTLRIHYKMT